MLFIIYPEHGRIEGSLAFGNGSLHGSADGHIKPGGLTTHRGWALLQSWATQLPPSTLATP